MNDGRIRWKLFVIGAAVAACLFAGCAEKKDKETASEILQKESMEHSSKADAALETAAAVSNPMREVDNVLAFESIGVHMETPDWGENLHYYIIHDEVADMRFTFKGVDYVLRGSNTADDFAGIFERFKEKAIAQTYDFPDGSAAAEIRTTESGGRLASWSWGRTKFTLYTAAEMPDEDICDITRQMVELNRGQK